MINEHEQAVIGVILRDDPEAYDNTGLGEDDFASAEARAVWQAIGAVIDDGHTPDQLTVGDRLPELRVTLADLTSTPAVRANLSYHAGEVRKAARKRRAETGLARCVDALRDQGVESLQEQLEMLLLQLSGDPAAGTPRLLCDALVPAIKELEARAQAGDCGGISCGFRKIDHMIGGLRPGDLVVIGARTSVGKTALALSMMHRMKAPTALLSLEMSEQEVVERLLAMESKVNMLRPYQYDWNSITSAADRLSERSIYVDDMRAGNSLSLVRSRARWLQRRGYKAVFIDYLTLVKHGDPRMPRPERVGEVVKSLKRLARELRIPIVVLSQLNRAGEGATPELDQLRQSGEIEEDADLVLMLDRAREGDRKTEATLIVRKNRRGPTEAVSLRFASEYATFTEA